MHLSRILSHSSHFLGAALCLSLAAGSALAGVKPETNVLNGSKVTFYPYPFFDEMELMTLRLVMNNAQALALFVPQSGQGTYASMAVAPDDGFLKDNKPVPTAQAMSNLPDAKTADAQALAACEAARKGKGQPCVIVLQVAPAR